MNRQKLTALLLSAALLLSLCACGKKDNPADRSTDPGSSASTSAPLEEEDAPVRQAEEEKAYPFGLGYFKNLGLNPYTCDNAQNQSIMGLLYEPLFELDQSFEAKPCLAQSITAKTKTVQRVVEEKKNKSQTTSYDSEEPQKVKTKTVPVTDVTVKLRSGVHFSDGSTVRADDVEYSLRRAGAKGSVYRSRLSGLTGLTTKGNNTVKFTLDGGNANVAELLDIPIIKKGQGDKQFPIGSGPYVVKLNKKGKPVRLEARSDWWRLGEEYEVALSKGVNLSGDKSGGGVVTRTIALPIQTIQLYTASDSDELIFGFSSGAVTAVSSDLTGRDALPYTGSYDVTDYPTTDLYYVGFNTAKGPCQEQKLRQAIYRSINREKVVTGMLAGHAEAAVMPVSPRSSLYDKELAEKLAYSRTKAEKLCKKAKTDDKLTLIVNKESSFKRAAAKELSRQLRDAGLSVKTESMTWAEYKEALEKGDYDLYLGEVKLKANFDLYQLINKDGDLNFSGYESDELNKAAKKYRQAGKDSRAEAAKGLFTVLGEEAPFAPVCFKCSSLLSHTGTVSRIRSTQDNLFHQVWDWVLDEKMVKASNGE